MNQSDAKELRFLAFLFLIAILTYAPYGIGIAHASSIKNIQIFQGTYSAGSDEQDFLLPEGAVDTDKTFMIITFNHTTASDQENVYRSWNFTNSSAIRMYGGSAVPADNDELKFVAYIIETFDAEVQHLLFNLSASQPEGEFVLPLDFPVNASASFLIFNGQDHDAVEGTWGSEELARVRLINSTHWGYQVGDTPNTEPTNIRVTIVEDNAKTVLVQNGTGIINGTTPSLTFLPPVNVTTNTSTIMCTFYIDGAGADFNERPRDSTMSCNLDPLETNATITTQSSITDSTININFHWQLITDAFDNEFILEHGTESFLGGVSVISETIGAVNLTNTIATLAVQTPFGQGYGQSNSPTAGTYDRVAFTLFFVANTTLLIERADSGGTGEVFWQVLEFLEVGVDPQKFVNVTDIATAVDVATEFDVTKEVLDIATVNDEVNATSTLMQEANVTDTATVSDQTEFDITKELQDTATGLDQIQFDVDKEAVDIGTTIDQETNMNITKLGADIASAGDTVNTNAVFVVELSDTGDVLDVFSINVTKLNLDLVTGLDETNFDITKAILDSATILDLVDTNLFAEIQLLDTTNINDDLEFEITKSLTDLLTVLDDPDFDIDKTIADIVTIIDEADPNVIREILQLDTVTANDEVRLEIIKAIIDVVAGSDEIELNITKGIIDTATILDLIDTDLFKVIQLLDTTTINDDLQFEITKTLTDLATVLDDPDFDVDKTIADIVTIIDEADPNVIREILQLDTVTANDEVRLEIIKAIIDVVTSSDELQLNITKGIVDTATILDLVNTELFAVIQILDTTNVNDELQFEITKALTDLSTVLDDPDKTIDKTIADIITIIDQADANVIREILQLDTVTANDEVRLEIIKAIIDVLANSDEVNFNITKLLSDTALVNDLISSTTTFGVDQLDTVTANDLIILDVTKQLSDVASGIDDLNLVPTKVLIDTTTIVDVTEAMKASLVNATDTAGTVDDIIIDVTKLIQDVSTVQDDIVVLRVIDIALNDTAIVDDPSVLFTLTSVPIGNGTGISSASSGGGVPSFQKLIGLSILSEFFFVEPADRVPSDFVIQTFGLESSIVSITNIEPDQQFLTWFEFTSFPQTLKFETETDNSKTFSDPARIKNTALHDFDLNVPTILCDDLDPFITPIPCIDKIEYEVPLKFTIKKGGITFIEKHIVNIDATMRVSCDIVCEIVAFMTANYWWLAGILIMFMLLYFLGGAIRKRGIRTIRRIDAEHFTSFSADKAKVKFKRGKGR